jgi:quercetin dioxygenase-like cupin family protein
MSSEDLQQGFARTLELSTEIEQQNKTKPWAKGYVSKVLLKTADLRLVLFAMQAGSRMPQHHSEGRIAVHCLRGSIRLQLPSEARNLQQDDILALDRKVEHDVQAIEDSVFLLTLVLPQQSSAGNA